jgi:hypothetical protein
MLFCMFATYLFVFSYTDALLIKLVKIGLIIDYK